MDRNLVSLPRHPKKEMKLRLSGSPAATRLCHRGLSTEKSPREGLMTPELLWAATLIFCSAMFFAVGCYWATSAFKMFRAPKGSLSVGDHESGGHRYTVCVARCPP